MCRAGLCRPARVRVRAATVYASRSHGLAPRPGCRRSHPTIYDIGVSVSCTWPGMPWAQIGEQVGHDDITTTSRVYTHVVADEAELDYAAVLA